MKRRFATLLVLLACAGPAGAQWLSLPTPGIPRTADGTPNLEAPTPHAADGHPDLTGLWRPERVKTELRDQSKLQPWVRKLAGERATRFNSEDPRYRCMPAGPDNLTVGNNSYGLRTILQGPGMIAMLYNDGTYRQIFMDGRSLEAQTLIPTWMGYSVGRWEGDTLVVESNGYNDKTWVSNGVSHTDALRITERYRRPDFGHIEVEVTYDDPGAFTAPLHASIGMDFAADEVMLETVCNEAYENGNWSTHVEKADDTEVEVAPEILAKYAGTYTGMYLRNLVVIKVTLEDGSLFLQKDNGRKSRLVPQSDTSFLIGGFGYVFTVDDAGKVTAISEVHVSGAWPYERASD